MDRFLAVAGRYNTVWGAQDLPQNVTAELDELDRAEQSRWSKLRDNWAVRKERRRAKRGGSPAIIPDLADQPQGDPYAELAPATNTGEEQAAAAASERPHNVYSPVTYEADEDGVVWAVSGTIRIRADYDDVPAPADTGSAPDAEPEPWDAAPEYAEYDDEVEHGISAYDRIARRLIDKRRSAPLPQRARPAEAAAPADTPSVGSLFARRGDDERHARSEPESDRVARVTAQFAENRQLLRSGHGDEVRPLDTASTIADRLAELAAAGIKPDDSPLWHLVEDDARLVEPVSGLGDDPTAEYTFVAGDFAGEDDYDDEPELAYDEYDQEDEWEEVDPVNDLSGFEEWRELNPRRATLPARIMGALTLGALKAQTMPWEMAERQPRFTRKQKIIGALATAGVVVTAAVIASKHGVTLPHFGGGKSGGNHLAEMPMPTGRTTTTLSQHEQQLRQFTDGVDAIHRMHPEVKMPSESFNTLVNNTLRLADAQEHAIRAGTPPEVVRMQFEHLVRASAENIPS
jgi:hypothetical protein